MIVTPRQAYRAGLHFAGSALIVGVGSALAAGFLFLLMVIAGAAHG